MGNVALMIQETHVNKTEGYQLGETDYYEPLHENPGELFRSLQREHGRCISKMYQDKYGQVLMCGWVFEKRVQYSDCSETYLCEMWVYVQWGYRFGLDVS